MTGAQTGATPPGPLEAYTYIPTGDRLSTALNGAAVQAYTYTPGTHQLASVGGKARSVDPNGNLVAPNAGAFPSFTYDNRNRLSGGTLSQASTPPICNPNTDVCQPGTTAATTITYAYDGRGERTGKTWNYVSSGGPHFTRVTVFSYDERGQLLGEYASTGAVGAEYVYLDGLPIALVSGTNMYYVETDHLGTPRQLIQPAASPANDTLVWKWDALGSAFGTNAPSVQTVTFNLRFPGQYYDAETGLNYNYSRDYEPGTGRYVESDPIGLIGGINSYRYSYASPLNYFDTTGLRSCTKIAAWPGLPYEEFAGSQPTGDGQWDLRIAHPFLRFGKNPWLAAASCLFGCAGADCEADFIRSYEDVYNRFRKWYIIEICTDDDCIRPELNLETRIETEPLGSRTEIRTKVDRSATAMIKIPTASQELADWGCRQWLTTLH